MAHAFLNRLHDEAQTSTSDITHFVGVPGFGNVARKAHSGWLLCTCCGTRPGQLHQMGCINERCPICERKAATCLCLLQGGDAPGAVSANSRGKSQGKIIGTPA
jgi:hypothetical protein